MTTLLWCLLVLNGLALIPTESGFKPKAFKLSISLGVFSLMVILSKELLSTLMNYPHIYVNAYAFNEVFRIPACLALIGLLIYRLTEAKNIMVVILGIVARALLPLIAALVPLLIFLGLTSLASMPKGSEIEENKKRRKRSFGHINNNGNFTHSSNHDSMYHE